MATGKFDRELRFIDTECRRLSAELEDLREMMPQNPLDAEKKAVDIGLIEERLGELLTRKKEIEDSFIAAGMEVPNIHNDLNANGCRDTPSYDEEKPQATQWNLPEIKEGPETEPASNLDSLSAQVASITDEMMQIEIKMLQAEIADDDSEKQKLEMSKNALQSRRDDLVARIKELKSSSKPQTTPVDDETEKRISALESDTRAIRSQVSMLRSDIGEMKDQLMRILEALNQDY